MKTQLPKIFLLSCLFFLVLNIAQAAVPVISYPTPQVYTLGTTITTVTPTNTGGAVTAFGYNTPTTFYNIPGGTPFTVSTDAAGNIYTADESGGNLIKITPGGVGTAINTTTLTNPTNVTVDGLGNIYVSDFGTNKVYKFNSTGTLIATYSGFNQPYGITVDASNNVYVSNVGGNNVFKITAGSASYTVSTAYISTGLTTPYGIAIDQSGNIYISSYTTNVVYKVPFGSTTPATFVAGGAGLNGPRNLFIDATGLLYVADYGNKAVKLISSTGTLSTIIPTGGILNNNRDQSVVPSGIMYIANSGSNAILKAVPSGGYFLSAPLPAGLTFNSTTGAISGTPTAITATTTYTVYAYNASGSSAAATFTITVQPVAPTATGGSNCGTGSVALSASGGTPAGGNYNWYSVSTGGTALQSSTSTTYNTPSISSTTTYYVSYTSGGVESARTAVTATINPAPNANFTAPAYTTVGTATTITLAVAVPTGTTAVYSFGDGSVVGLPTPTTPQASWPTPGIKQLTLTLTTSSGCTASYSTSIIVTQNVTAANYAFSQPITLNTSAMGITSTLTNFPALVYIKENALIASGASLQNCATNVNNPTGTGSYGYDFAFTLNGSTNELFYQVESYDPTTGTLLAWVNLPTVTSTNSSLTFYFGSSNPNHTAAFTQATWPSDYQAVYHFNEGSTSAVVLDATANVKNASQNNTGIGTGEIHSAAGITGGGYTFNGTSTDIVSSTGADLTSSFTLSGWVNISSFSHGTDQKMVSDEYSSGNGGYKVSLYGTSATNVKSEVETRDASGNSTIDRYASGGTVLNTGTWYYIQGVYDATSNTFYSYVNGALDRSLNPAAAAASGGDIYMGTDYNNSNWFQGTMNEIRLSNVVKSPDWIKAEYYNQTNPITFTTCGTTITGVLANSAPIGGAVVYTWTGLGGTNPSVALNWRSSAAGTPTGVPPFDGTCTLNIPGGLGIYPILTANISVYGLTMGAGATITLGNYTLNVGCHIYNNSAGTGSITSTTSGGINFNGLIATQNYYCSSTNTNTIANLTLNNTAAGTLDITGSGNVSVSNLLTVTKGNIVIDPTGSLVLTSTAAGSANVAIIPSAYTISGNVTVQRYIPGGTALYRSYRLITLPVNVSGLTNNQTSTTGIIDLHSLNAGMITAGPGTGFLYPTPTTNPLMYLYDENRAQNLLAYVAGKNVGIYSLATGSPYQDTYYPKGAAALPAPTAKASVPVGNSVQVYYVGPYSATPTLTATAPAATTTSATGYLNQGTIPVHIFSTGTTTLSWSPTINTTPAQGLGLNQVGNPYASTIDLDSLYYDNMGGSTAIGPIFWELKQPSNTFVAYNGATHTVSTAGSGAEAYIASGQGFFVQAISANSSLTFFEREKVNLQIGTSTSPVLILSQRARSTSSLMSADTNSMISAAEVLPSGLAGLHLQISKDTATYTQTGIYFSKSWSDKYTPLEDAIDLDGTAPKVYLSSYSTDGARLCINQLGDYSKGKTVKIFASATKSGAYTISLADINNIDPLYNVYLRDHKLNDSVDLRTANSYSFNIATNDTTTYGANRFDLVLERTAVPPYQLLSFAGQKVNTGVQLNWKASNAGTYTGFTLEKQISNNTYTPIYTIQSDSSTTYSFVDKNPIEGANVYRLEQNDINGNITYSSLVTIGYNNVSSNGFFSVYPNPSKDVINILVNSTTATSPNYTADIYNTSGVLVDHRVLNTFTWTENISNYKEGVYIIAIKSSNGDVMAKSKFIKTK